MIEHLSDHQIKQYRVRSLPPELILAANDHLFSCEDCFQRFQALSGSPAAESISVRFDQAEWDHDAIYDHIEAYVDDQMPLAEREFFESHLQNCPKCTAEADDLLSLKASMSRHRESGGWQDGKPGSVSPTARPMSFYAQGIHAVRPWMGASAVLLLAVLTSWTINAPLRKGIVLLQEQVGALEGANEVIRQQAETEIHDLSSRLKEVEGRERAVDPASTGPEIVIVDGSRRIRLEGDTLTGLESAPAYFRMAIKRALLTSRIDIPRLQMLEGKPSVMMGRSPGASPLILTNPVGIVVEDDRPVFTWAAAAGAASYTVSIRDVKSGAVVTSSPTSENRWRSSAPLSRGRIYSWDVRALLSDGREISASAPPAPESKFKILGNFDESRLQEARRLAPQSHLLMGLLYAKAGLIDAARRELRALVEANPNSHVAREFLQAIEVRR